MPIPIAAVSITKAIAAFRTSRLTNLRRGSRGCRWCSNTVFQAAATGQWWNSRSPVKTITMPYSSAARMMPSSRVEPPVWTT